MGNDMVTLMRLQYRDATYPRMKGTKTKSPDIDVLDVPIMYFGPVEDPSATVASCGELWKTCTRSTCELVEVSHGHMDCLMKPGSLLEKMPADMEQFVPKGERTL